MTKRRAKSEKLQSASIKTLRQDEHNANRGTQRGAEMLRTSLQRHGAGRSILLDKHNRIIAGNKTAENYEALGRSDVIVVESDGSKLIAVRRTDLDLETDASAKELAIADNRVGEISLDWDPDILAKLGADVDLSGLFSADELAELMAAQAASGVDLAPAGSLAERFGVPPFSVLDARQGYWQERKRAWLALGIESELGRGEVLTYTESEEIIGDGLHHFRREKKRMSGTPPHPPTVRRNKDGSLNYNGTAGQSKRFNAQRQGAHIARKIDPSPGGSPRPAANYKNRQRGTGSGKAIKK